MNMTQLLREAQERDVQFLLMRHSEPVARIVPFDRGTTLDEVMHAAPRSSKKVKGKKTMKKPARRGGLRRIFGL